jgi:hypothetical protein
MDEPIDWAAYEDLAFALLPDDRGGEDMPRKIHDAGVRKRPTPQPTKPVKRPAKQVR